MTKMKPKSSIEKISKSLRKELDAQRYQHTIGVMYTATAMAMAFGEDLEKAQLAGLLHDCAKCIPNEKKVKLCKKYSIAINPIEEAAPFLLHAKLGAEIARREYGIEDEDILGAIRFHTTGRPQMTRLEAIVFLADYIEPMRNKAQNLTEIRRLAFQDLDLAVYITLRDTLQYLEGKETLMDETTQQAFHYYEDLIQSRGEDAAELKI